MATKQATRLNGSELIEHLFEIVKVLAHTIAQNAFCRINAKFQAKRSTAEAVRRRLRALVRLGLSQQN